MNVTNVTSISVATPWSESKRRNVHLGLYKVGVKKRLFWPKDGVLSLSSRLFLRVRFRRTIPLFLRGNLT